MANAVNPSDWYKSDHAAMDIILDAIELAGFQIPGHMNFTTSSVIWKRLYDFIEHDSDRTIRPVLETSPYILW